MLNPWSPWNLGGTGSSVTDAFAQELAKEMVKQMVRDWLTHQSEGGDDAPPDEKPESKQKLKPEDKYYGGKKHGIKWTEGPQTAAHTDTPQGQWGSEEDLDYATRQAETLKPGEYKEFPLPEGSTSVVHKPDGTTVPATKIWVRNNGTGTWHGYPKE